METPIADVPTHVATASLKELPQDRPEPAQEKPKDRLPASSRVPSIIVAIVGAAIASLSVWYLVRGEPLLVQGEVDATRFDIAARVDGRVGDIPVSRGEN